MSNRKRPPASHAAPVGRMTRIALRPKQAGRPHACDGRCGLRLANWWTGFCTLLILLALAGPAARAQETASSGLTDSGVFQVLAGAARVGTERFQIRRSGTGWEASAELQIESGNNKVSETASLRLDAALQPSSYERVQKSPLTAAIKVQFGGAAETTLVVTGGPEPEEQVFYLPANDLVVLDTNFFHHYALLVARYDRAKGGTQPFNVFIPQEALPGTISLQLVGRDTAAAGEGTKELDHFQAVTDELQIEIWATPAGAIQRIAIPQANLEVVRQ